MTRAMGFWIASGIILFLISIFWFHFRLHKFNPFFTYWLGLGVFLQIVATWWVAARRAAWMTPVFRWIDGLTYALAACVLVMAIFRRSQPVNRTLLYGLGAMLAFNLLAKYLGAHADLKVGATAWLRNIAFFGPGIYLLICFSGIRFDRLPLRTFQHEDSKTLRIAYCQERSTSLGRALTVVMGKGSVKNQRKDGVSVPRGWPCAKEPGGESGHGPSFSFLASKVFFVSL